jgi:SAM-dependent methyltransferase
MSPPPPLASTHYDRFLASRYTWMAGGFDENTARNREFFAAHRIRPALTGAAIDLGAGCGFASIPLAGAGFRVTAVDLCRPLLDELAERAAGTGIEVVPADLLDFPSWAGRRPELITCLGDTLTHLPSTRNVRLLVRQCHAELVPGGRLVITLRNYAGPEDGTVAVIPVRRDADRIFLCRLEYGPAAVTVTDICYSRPGGRWEREAGSYRKIRIAPAFLKECLAGAGFGIGYCCVENRIVSVIAEKVP